ncbi:hypothetical protein Plec18167_001586 [Paecilomyces lecythidis]|uniref:Ribosome-associated complex head domain-containing protein n=1 Tax=Paecilomyces lecythidis TaxID=3004212 RepID=A0ABR3YBU6_9EURO
MSFFVSVISPNASDNEFGPGLYATKDFTTAVNYSHPNSAVMVFKDPDFRDLNVWRPDRPDWNSLTAHWLSIPLHDLKPPRDYKEADVVVGALSENQSQARVKKTFATPGECVQMACNTDLAAKIDQYRMRFNRMTDVELIQSKIDAEQLAALAGRLTSAGKDAFAEEAKRLVGEAKLKDGEIKALI